MSDNPHIYLDSQRAKLCVNVMQSHSSPTAVLEMQLKQIFVALAEPADCDLVQFYRGLFAQDPVVWRPGIYAEFDLPGLKLGVFQPQAAHQAEFQGGAGSISLCLEVALLESAIERLDMLGYPPPGAILQTSHGREIYAYDPAGNRLILHQRP